MLTSSDAKWRCLWHMLVWSGLLILVSQFMEIQDHIALFFLAAMTMIVLPIITAVYSNTSGRHGAGLLRAGYVVCDPVLACVTVLPVLLLNRLPNLIEEYNCLEHHRHNWNITTKCLNNISDDDADEYYDSVKEDKFLQVKEKKFLVLQCCMVVPIIVSLMMGRRTRKMSYNVYVLVFVYWFVTTVEAVNVMEVVKLGVVDKHVICTTESIVAIVIIVTNSYAVVTLCSYITPTSSTHLKSGKKFDRLYAAFIAASGILFAEIPLFITKIQILYYVHSHDSLLLPGTFYMWMLKNILFTGLIAFMILVRRVMPKKYARIPCRPLFDSKDVFFKPEKRDIYIEKTRDLSPSPATCLADKTAEEKGEKKSKKVRFKFDLGMGRFSVEQARDDGQTDIPIVPV